MNPEKRRAVLIGVMMTMLLVAAIWNINWMMTQRRSAAHAAKDLAMCRELQSHIEMLRQKPAVASTEALASQELGQLITTAAKQAKLPNGPPRDVFPQAARGVGDSPYLVKPTLLTLRGVTLQQLSAFLYHLSGDSGLDVRDLRLRRPKSRETANAWNAEATVTYLIYKPRGKTPRNKRGNK